MSNITKNLWIWIFTHSYSSRHFPRLTDGRWCTHTHTHIYILYCRISNCSLAGSRNSICIRAELQLLCAPDLPEPSQSTRTLTVYRCEIDIKQVLFRPFCFVATKVIPSRILAYTRPMYWRIVSTNASTPQGYDGVYASAVDSIQHASRTINIYKHDFSARDPCRSDRGCW